MAAKLRSILRQTRSSLLLKAAVFALAWFFFPFWLFLLVALYLYFVPWFQTRKLLAPFLALLVLAYLQPAGLVFFLIFGALFYYLLLIKDLLVIDRRSAYELLVLALSFFLLRDFYGRFGGALTGAGFFWGFLTAALIGLLVRGFIRSFAERADAPENRAAAGVSFLLIWQFLMLGLFLPLDFVYQSVIVFLAVVLVADIIPERYLGGSSRTKLFVTSATVFTLAAIVLASAQW
ncbi:MAG TPA: hypothetical protein VMT81_03560 [Candidatus Paceibacterota bacterium]|nr:hypothetical protein [Candidatus Paceibacterota bacterium]